MPAPDHARVPASGPAGVGGPGPAARRARAAAAPGWAVRHRRRAVAADAIAALAAGVAAMAARQLVRGRPPSLLEVWSGVCLPLAWCLAVRLAGGYAERTFGRDADEFRRVLSAGVALLAVIAITGDAVSRWLAPGFVTVMVAGATVLALAGRLLLRAQLLRARRHGACLVRTVVAGPAAAVADLIADLRQDPQHGLSVVAACLAEEPAVAGCPAEPPAAAELGGVPVAGGLDRVAGAAATAGANLVLVAACRELSGMGLRALAWQLEAAGVALCLAPVPAGTAGARASIRPASGLPMVHLAGRERAGVRGFARALPGLAAVMGRTGPD